MCSDVDTATVAMTAAARCLCHSRFQTATLDVGCQLTQTITPGPASHPAVNCTLACPRAVPAGTWKYNRYRLTAPGYPIAGVIEAGLPFTNTAPAN